MRFAFELVRLKLLGLQRTFSDVGHWHTRVTKSEHHNMAHDPNIAVKSLLGAAIAATSFAASMVAEPQVTGSTALRGSQVLLEVSQEVIDATPGADMLATGMAMAPIIAPVIGAAISSATKTCLRRRAASTSKFEDARDDADQAEPSPISK